MKKIVFLFCIFTAFYCLAQSPAASLNNSATSSETDPLVVQGRLNPLQIMPSQGGYIELQLFLPEGFHAYQDQFRLVVLEPDGFQVGTLKIEPMIQWYDKFSKKNRMGIKDKAVLSVHVEAPSSFKENRDQLKLSLTYQACSTTFCLFPTEKIFTIPAKIIQTQPEGLTVPPLNTQTEKNPDTDVTFFSKIQNIENSQFSDWQKTYGLWMFLIVFLGGVLTSFTPCIFPMIPITISILGHGAEKRSRLQNFLLSLIYVFGIAFTYSVMGVFAASTGALFGSLLGNTYFLSAVCIVFLLMALSQLGLFDFEVPYFIQRLLPQPSNSGGYKNAFFSGLFAGLVASPCVGPVLVAILTFVANSKSLLLGFSYLFVYALGLGMIFIVLGLFNQWIKYLPKSGSWMVSFKKFLGLVMFIPFYYYLKILVPERVFDFLLGLGFILISSYFGAFERSNTKSKIIQICKGLLWSFLVVGSAYILVAIFNLRPLISASTTSTTAVAKESQKLPWQNYSAEILQEAKINNKAVLLDFWAEWCAACLEMEEKTFSDPEVKKSLQNIVLLKYDASQESEVLKQLRQKYQIVGLPTLLFINSKGEVLTDLTLTQFEEPKDFMTRLQQFSKMNNR